MNSILEIMENTTGTAKPFMGCQTWDWLTIEEKISEIKQILSKNSFMYENIPDNMVDIIYDLFMNNIAHDDVDSLDNDIAYLYYGNYYLRIEKNDELTKKYYIMAADKENAIAMYNLAYHYECNEKNNELANKYYIMAADKGIYNAINRLFFYYRTNNYDLAKKYCLMIDTNTHKKERIQSINILLRYNFDIEFAIDMHEFLDRDNIIRFNQEIYGALL